MNISAEDAPSQLLFAGIRFILAGMMVIAVLSLQKHGLVIPERSAVRPIAVLALFQTVLQYIFFYIGLAHASAARAAIINGLGTFITIIIAVYFFRFESMTRRKFAGCLLGFAGIVILETMGKSITFGFRWNGEGFLFITIVVTSIASNYIKLFSREHDPAMLSGYQFLLGGIVLMMAGVFAGGRITFTDSRAILLIIYMGFISSAAYTFWGILLKYNPVSNVAIFNFVTPIAGLVLSTVLLREQNVINLYSIISIVLVSLGIITVSKTYD